jgi:AGZA family xanthine/uracil permease-like MFS transporter
MTAYILTVNAQIMGHAGMDKQNVVVSTALSAALGTFIVGFFGNLPFITAPGLGLSAYFSYGLVLNQVCFFLVPFSFVIFVLFDFLSCSLLR